MNIILIAPPAAGKGTQSELICSKYHLNHISTGDLLRVAISQDNEESREIKELMNKGELIGDDIIMDLVEKEINEKKGFVFDGFPRNIKQANLLDELLVKTNNKIDYVLYLKIDKDIASSRITNRYVCPKCNKIYNLNAEDNLVCQNCGENLFKRKDDNIETFNNRYDVYMNDTYPIIEYYKQKGILYEVDSSKTPNEVFSEIENIVGD